MDMITLAAARKYVNDTANALGAVKGSPCTIKSITETDDGATVVFSWTGADGVEQTSSTFLPRGPQGLPGEKGEPGAPGKDGSGTVDTVARKQITALSEEIGGLKENGGNGTDEVVRELLEVVPGASKNLNVSGYVSKEQNGATFVVNDDHTVTITGTPTKNTYLVAGKENQIANGFILPPGQYHLSGSRGTSGKRVIGYVCLYDGDTLAHEYRDTGNGITFTTDVEYNAFVQILLYPNEQTDITVGMQLEAGSAATEYVSPYSDELHSARLASIEERLEAVEDAVIDLPVPNYYFANNYLPDKAARINALGEQVAGKGDVFAFITDQHWNLNAKKSPALIEYLSKNCHIPRLFCGGDIGSSYIAEYDALMQKAFDGEIRHIIGNHEYNGSKTGSQLAYLLDMGKWMQVGNSERHYYYVDNPQQKIRYIVLAAFDEGDASNYYTNGYEADQIAWLTDKALATEAGWNVLIFAHQTHFWRTGELVQIGYAKTLLDTLDAYNGNAEIVAIFSGHSHVDGIMHTTGGIPIIVTCCDKWTKYVDSTGAADFDRTDRAEGTITEQAFDVVAFDPANRTLTCVRIGAPAENRVDNVLDGMVEERVVTY